MVSTRGRWNVVRNPVVAAGLVLVVMAATAVVSTLATPAAAGSTGTAGSDTTAHHFTGTPTVGALFIPGLYPQLHTCTASVVRSPGHNIIVTAAHCLQPQDGAGYVFAPGYHDGLTPYGTWTTTAAYASEKWIKRDGDTRRDFVFLTVAARTVNGKREKIQDVVGGNRLGLRARAKQRVRITGYPLGAAGKPLTCLTKVFLHRGYPGSHCHGFADGTSGGPWLAGHGKVRTVVGLISGLHQGGCSPKVVYSSPLGHPARSVLARAEHHRHPSTMPTRPGDGCPSSNVGTPAPVG
jgi:hypothetical protein